MSIWTKQKFNQIVDEKRAPYNPLLSEQLPYLGLEHIEQQSLRITGIGDSKDIFSQKKKFTSGDILYGSLRPYFRKVFLPKFDGICSTDITVLVAKNNNINTYIFYLIASKEFIDKATSASNGTKMPRAGWNIIKDFVFDIPDLPTQTQIASVLSSYDDLIENNEKHIKVLEEMAQLLYTEWFVKFKFPGHEKVKMVSDSNFGKLPDGWEVTKIGKILTEIVSGSRPKGGINPNERGVPSIGAENVNGLGIYDYSKEKFVSEEFFENMRHGHVQNDDILLYKDGAHIGRKTMVGNGFPHEKCSINEHVFILRTNKYCSQSFLYFWLDQPTMTQSIRNLNANAAQPGINQEGVKNLIIILPHKKVLDNFDTKVNPILDLIFLLAKQNRIISQIRDILILQLVTGKRELK